LVPLNLVEAFSPIRRVRNVLDQVMELPNRTAPSPLLQFELLYRDNQFRFEGIHVIAEQYLLYYQVDDVAHTKHMRLLCADTVLSS
jgi:hypothetical protein